VTGATTAKDAFEKLKSMVPACVVTNGPNGAFIRFGGRSSDRCTRPKSLPASYFAEGV